MTSERKAVEATTGPREPKSTQGSGPDHKLSHAREFTDVENTTLTLWNELQDAGQQALALRVLDAGLMVEHYTSLLDNDPAKRSDDELRQLSSLRAVMDRVNQQGRAVLDSIAKGTPGPDTSEDS